ncbi:MAG: AI-2E family transporter [Ruminococcaceae bacterium]|nr:AI-2E family transporter [Oscillospiraceae bacterium]MBE6904425.1 AI-2E family transporter [Oscillospiraceae bacterium]
MSSVKLWAITILLVVTAVIGYLCLPVITPFLLGFVFAYVLYTPTKFLEKKLKIKSWLAAIIVIVLCVVIIGLLVYFFVPKIASQGKALLSGIPEITKSFNAIINDIQNRLIEYEMPPEIIEGVNTALNGIYKILSDLIIQIINYIFGLLGEIVNIFLIIVITIYMLIDGKRIIDSFMAKMPEKYEDNARKISDEINELMKNYVRAQFVIAAITGVCTFLILFILRSPYALVLGMLAFLLNFIPYFGATVVTIIAGAIALFTGGLPAAAATWLLLTVFGQIKGNVINPKIQSKAGGVHPLAVLLAILVCSHHMGVIGVFFAVIIAGFIKILYRNALEMIAEIKR